MDAERVAGGKAGSAAVKRRSFLQLLGGAAAAGPQAAKSAAEMAFVDLSLFDTGIAGGPHYPPPARESSDATGWAREDLKKMLAKAPAAIERERRDWRVTALEPDVAVLRSVALGAKIRMSRERQFWRARRMRQTFLEGILAGLWE
jgi:hypothetical protein